MVAARLSEDPERARSACSRPARRTSTTPRSCASRTGCTCWTRATTGTTWSSPRRRATASCATPAPRCSAAARRTTRASPSGRRARTSTSGRRWAATGWSADECWPLIKRLETNDAPGDHHGRSGPVNIRTVPPEDPCGVAILEAAAQAGLPTSPFNAGHTVTNGAGWFQINSGADNTRMSSSHAYLHPIIGSRPNLEIRTHCWASRVVARRPAPRDRRRVPDARPAHARRRSSARREVILSAGAIDTPKLLMLSGIGPGEHLQEFGDRRRSSTRPAWARTSTTTSRASCSGTPPSR